MSDNEFPGWHGTTIVAVRKGSKVVVAGDGQVSVGNTVMKHQARKVRPLAGGKVIGKDGKSYPAAQPTKGQFAAIAANWVRRRSRRGCCRRPRPWR